MRGIFLQCFPVIVKGDNAWTVLRDFLPDEFLDRVTPDCLSGLDEIKLDESFRSGETLYVRTESDRYPEAARLLGAAIVIDLVTLTADLQGREFRGLVLIDSSRQSERSRSFACLGALATPA